MSGLLVGVIILAVLLAAAMGAVTYLIIRIRNQQRVDGEQHDEEQAQESSSTPSTYTSHSVFAVKPPRMEDVSLYARLEELLVKDPKGTSVLTEIFHPRAMEEVAQSLVVLFESHDQAVSLVKCFIDLEMAKANEGEGPTTLFRRDSVASKIMRFYTKLIGQQYLISVLWPNIRAVCLSDDVIEIDRLKMKKEDSLEEHLARFQDILANFLESIVNSASLCPPQLRAICHHLNSRATQFFPDNNIKVVSGFIFLRFFTPAIISPTAYGLVEGELTANQSRTLVLVAKVMQNLANGILFGGKEQFMMPLNDFLTTNTPLVKDFFD